MDRSRSPFRDIERMFERMNEQFEESSGMAVDVAENDEEVTVTADLPGYDRDQIDVTVDDRRLTIRAERERETETDEEYHRRERSFRRQTRTITLPAEVDERAASATYRNGVLEITLPKEGEPEEEGHSVDIE
ncbi:MAG: archaeal heat shock protein Hsp14 [Haloferacaceae archaeon]